MSLSAIPTAIRKNIFKRDLGRCQYCRLAQVGQAAVFHINHITPKSKGGRTEESNLALQCPYCSLHKSDKTSAIDPASGRSVPLFHPLQDQWVNHFQIDAAGIYQGITEIGRATVVALQINDPLPRTARVIQMRLGLFL